MSVYHRSTAKSRILQEYREREQEIAAALSSQMSPKEGLASEKRIRREIANSNERRRMQSINAGFQLLRTLIPHSEGEKLSKAAILQQTTEYIKTLMHEKAKILEQNAYYRKLLSDVSRRCNVEFDLDVSLYGGSPPRKRKKRDTESSDEGIAADFEDLKYDDFKRELNELRQQLDKERHLRLILENRSPHALDMHQYAEKVFHAEHHLKMQPEQEKVHIEDVKSQEMTVTYSTTEDIKHEEPISFNPLRIDLEGDCRVPSASPHRSDSSDSVSSSMSRRKLETLVEAIQYVEGDDNQMDQGYCKSVNSLSYMSHAVSVPNSEESEKDSSITSDQDDIRSESSGRDSPSLHQQYARLQSAQNLQPISQTNLGKHLSGTSVVVTTPSYMDKYPAVTNVLQGNMSKPQFLYRPAVIHKT